MLADQVDRPPSHLFIRTYIGFSKIAKTNERTMTLRNGLYTMYVMNNATPNKTTKNAIWIRF
jgi:hypothetical protein